jgi:hypothetical protein
MATKKAAALRKFSYYFDGDCERGGIYDGSGIIKATDHNHAMALWIMKKDFIGEIKARIDIFKLTDVETEQVWTAKDFSTPGGTGRFHLGLSEMCELEYFCLDDSTAEAPEDESMLKEGSFVKYEGEIRGEKAVVYYFPEGEPSDWVK